MKGTIVIAIASSWLAATAAAADVEVDLRVEAQGNDQAPRIEATLFGAARLPADHYTLAVTNTAQQVRGIATRDFRHGDETLPIAIVVCGWEVWIGNDKLVPEDDASRYAGVLEGLERAIDAVHFETLAPDGSRGMLITYADKPTIRVPMGPLAKLTGAALGSQRDYFGTVGHELVSSIDLALAELHRTIAGRKVLIVIGDGNDTNDEAARDQLKALKKQAAQEGIHTYAITYKSPLSDEGNVIAALTPSARTVNTVDGIAAALASIVSQITDVTYVTFPGFDERTGTGLPWDGQQHELVVTVGNDVTDPVVLSFPRGWEPPHTSHSQQVIGMLIALLCLLGWFTGLPMLERR